MTSDLKSARPLLKWAGGKNRLVPELTSRIPERFNNYHEPFVGGGALFWALASCNQISKIARITDTNEVLIRTYQAIQEDVEGVVRLLKDMPNDKNFFLTTRGRDILNEAKKPAEVAAWLIYLNKTAFNGLYRVNSKGMFNVPFGDYARPTICDEENLRACSRVLKNTKTEIHVMPFEGVLDYAKPGDFVYMDSPYMPTSKTSNFTAYTAEGFGMERHILLRDVARRLKGRGVHVLLSHSETPEIRNLYSTEDFIIDVVSSSRSISASTKGRGKVTELIVR